MGRIAGIVTHRPAAAAKELLASMIGSMLHERFNTYGTYCVPELGFYLAWVADSRLGEDTNPIVNAREDQVVVLAGETFTDGAQIAQPGQALLSQWDARGDRALRDLNGWFAGAVVDLKARSLLLFNDRFGIHRIYCTQSPDVLAFASEAKALLAIQPGTRNLNPEALGEFVAFGSVFNDRTLFQDVTLLPGGSAWTITRPTEIQKKRYFTPDEWESQPSLSEDDFYERLKSTMSRAVRRHFAGTSEVAVSLTGGVDTRIIMACADQAGHARASYTYGGMYRDCYDVRIAADVASACGYRHQVLRLDQNFLSRFSECAEKTIWLTDGTLDLGATHEVYLTGLASTIAPVRITGNYGSEILRGASTFKPSHISTGLFNPDFVPHIQAAARSFAAVKSRHQVTFAAFQEIPWNLHGRLNAAQSQLTVRSPYTDNDLVALAYQAPAAVREAPGLWNRLILEQKPALASIPTDRGRIGTASSWATLPNRLYNHLLFKGEWYHEAGMPHWLARLERHLPNSWRPLPFVGTHKIEHYRMWFRNELFDYLRSVLHSNAAETPYVDAGRARAMLTAHREGRGNYVTDIQRLTTIALIQKLFIVAPLTNAVPAGSIRVDGRLPRKQRESRLSATRT